MKSVWRFAFAAAICLALAPTAQAQQAAPAQTGDKPAAQKPDSSAAQKPEQKPDEPQKYEETVVVSASKTDEKLINAPATMTVIPAQTIELAPSQDFAELLRAVPGVNVTQVSARDINVTPRGATSTLSTGTLALLDGRSLYQDFFGFVMWDFLPVNLDEIKQIEVIRGPASAVWGANALNGVVNVITKSPREMQGTTAQLGVGGFDRSSGQATNPGAGTLFYINGSHAQAINDRWAYRISAGGYTQDPYARPTGQIPCNNSDVCTPNGTTTYPPFVNKGTTQPKFDARVDYDYPDGRKLSFSGGVAGTAGIMETGIGPFDIDSGSVMGYAKADYTDKGLNVQAFTNLLNGNANNLLTIDARTGAPVAFDFNTKTFDVEASDVHTFAQKHVVTFGGNLRHNTFDLSLAPLAKGRTEAGAYVQDEIFLTKMYRLVAGGRVDKLDYVDNAVFSPRVTFMIKPQENQTVRVSYNRAYRSPSVINEFLNVTIAEPIDLSPFAVVNPALLGKIYPLPVVSEGNQDLKVTSVDAFELGYTGVVAKGKAIVSGAFYINRTTNDILFTELTSARYTAANPPPGWPLPPFTIGLIPGASLPSTFTYLNFGRTTDKGIELGLQSTINQYVNAFANYSYQAKPNVNFPLSEVNLPPKNRFNAGFGFSRDRYLGDFSVAFTDSAFWQDVLNEPFHGTTDAYTLLNGGFGVKWANNRLTTSVKATNIANQRAQEHVFGDIVGRQVVGELKVNF
jgi:outer membrane receptor protein involved in Fe transport